MLKRGSRSRWFRLEKVIMSTMRQKGKGEGRLTQRRCNRRDMIGVLRANTAVV